MRKIVVSIIAVFFVQIGFQVYSSIERMDREFASIGVAQGPEDTPNKVLPADVPGDLYMGSNGSPAAGNGPQKIRYLREVRREQARHFSTTAAAREPRRHEVVGSGAIGPDIVITIPPPTVRPPYSAPNARLTYSIRHEKKGSFFSKSLHVLKKPYDWLKTVAMKLD